MLGVFYSVYSLKLDCFKKKESTCKLKVKTVVFVQTETGFWDILVTGALHRTWKKEEGAHSEPRKNTE